MPPRAPPLLAPAAPPVAVPAAPPPEAAAGEWVQITSASTGLAYWYHTASGESSWTLPPAVAAAREREQQAAADALRRIDEPDAWAVRVSRDGRPYFECPELGITTWQRPACLDVLALLGQSFGSGAAVPAASGLSASLARVIAAGRAE